MGKKQERESKARREYEREKGTVGQEGEKD